MKTKVRKLLPWGLAALFATAFLVTLSRDGRSAPPAGGPGAPPAAASSGERKILYWVDPMHPAYKSDKPGIAPDCGMELVPVYADGGSAAPPASVEGYSSLTLPPERQRAIGVAVGPAERRELVQTVRAVGRVAADERRLHEVHAKFEGYVEKLYVDFTGRSVRRGEPLLTIYSPELLATQQEYLLASRARKELARSGNPDAARGGVDLYESSKQRLLLWDISPAEIARLERTGQPRRALTLHSPVAGVVTGKNVVAGARVMPADTLFEIADFSRVWVLADVYESEAPLVRVGQRARVTLSHLPGREWIGSVSFIAPVLQPESRTVQVRLEFPNSDGTLKPEMFAEVVLERSLGRVVTVPDSAVLSTGTRSIVFVAKGDAGFEPREVVAGATTGGYREIRHGIEAGEKVVTQANFLVDSESRLKAALAGIAPPPPGGHEGHSPAEPPKSEIRRPSRATAAPARVATPDPHAGHRPAATPTPDHSGHVH